MPCPSQSCPRLLCKRQNNEISKILTDDSFPICPITLYVVQNNDYVEQQICTTAMLRTSITSLRCLPLRPTFRSTSSANPSECRAIFQSLWKEETLWRKEKKVIESKNWEHHRQNKSNINNWLIALIEQFRLFLRLFEQILTTDDNSTFIDVQLRTQLLVFRACLCQLALSAMDGNNLKYLPFL